jgi:hypothetical protein
VAKTTPKPLGVVLATLLSPWGWSSHLLVPKEVTEVAHPLRDGLIVVEPSLGAYDHLKFFFFFLKKNKNKKFN